MKRRIIYKLLLIAFLLDCIYSFFQFYHTPIYGDMGELVIPKPGNRFYTVLHDPFGLNVLLKNEIYANPNRFFSNWSVSTYFLNMPLALQVFVQPIESVYLSCAIAKIIFQILLIYLLSVFISNNRNIFDLDLLIAAILITPLFQTNGLNRYMGIIDQSVVYNFFYALPLGLLMLFFLPFYHYYSNRLNLRFNYLKKILWFLLMFILTLSGPLNPGVVLILCTMILLNMIIININQNKNSPIFKRIKISLQKLPNIIMFYFISICILGLYSLYIGINNSNNLYVISSLGQRYTYLYNGICNLFIHKLGFPWFIIIIVIIVNVIIIMKFFNSDERIKVLKPIKWIVIFSVIYLFALPFGGFRIYRPDIIRYDTLMPITFGIIFYFGLTTFCLIKKLILKYKRIYLAFVMVFLLFFTLIDRIKLKDYLCEKNAIETISRSKEKIVALDSDCSVMEWHQIYDYKQSEYNAELFYHWNITKEIKYYYFIPNY